MPVGLSDKEDVIRRTSNTYTALLRETFARKCFNALMTWRCFVVVKITFRGRSALSLKSFAMKCSVILPRNWRKDRVLVIFEPLVFCRLYIFCFTRRMCIETGALSVHFLSFRMRVIGRKRPSFGRYSFIFALFTVQTSLRLGRKIA